MFRLFPPLQKNSSLNIGRNSIRHFLNSRFDKKLIVDIYVSSQDKSLANLLQLTSRWLWWTFAKSDICWGSNSRFKTKTRIIWKKNNKKNLCVFFSRSTWLINWYLQNSKISKNTENLNVFKINRRNLWKTYLLVSISKYFNFYRFNYKYYGLNPAKNLFIKFLVVIVLVISLRIHYTRSHSSI